MNTDRLITSASANRIRSRMDSVKSTLDADQAIDEIGLRRAAAHACLGDMMEIMKMKQQMLEDEQSGVGDLWA